MIIKANQEDTNEILKHTAQALFEGTRGNCQLSTEKAIEITKADCRKRSILFNH